MHRSDNSGKKSNRMGIEDQGRQRIRWRGDFGAFAKLRWSTLTSEIGRE